MDRAGGDQEAFRASMIERVENEDVINNCLHFKSGDFEALETESYTCVAFS